jgi:putative ABC transport system permease protein
MSRGVQFFRSCLSLAWHNLGHRPTRTVAAVAGLAFAIILIFLQLGFLGSAEESADLIPEHLDFDVLIVSSQFVDLNRAGALSRRRVAQAEAVPGVDAAVPVYVGLLKYRNPMTRSAPHKAGVRRNMMVLGIDPDDVVFDAGRLPGAHESQRRLDQSDAMLYDLASRDQFVPPDGTEPAELGGRRMRVVGTFRLGTGFGADGLAVVGDDTFCDLTDRLPDTVNLGLVRIDPASGLTAADMRARLEQALPRDVRVWTKAEMESRLRTHWVWEMPIGIIFVFGTGVALVVGVVFGYQVISSDIANRLREFATLKALGYTNSHLTTTVVVQAWALAAAAYVVSFGVACGVYALLQWQASIPMGMNAVRAVGVLAASVGMCSLAAWLALGRVKTADPANLF